MNACPSCGGIIGIDCFNPQECAEISYQQQQFAQRDTDNTIQSICERLDKLEIQVAELKAKFNLP